MRLDPRDAVRFSALSSPDEILAGAANPYHAARPRRVSAAGLRPLQAKLSRNSNQIARGRIRQIAVGTLITERPPHRTVRAQFGHTAPTLGVCDGKAFFVPVCRTRSSACDTLTRL